MKSVDPRSALIRFQIADTDTPVPFALVDPGEPLEGARTERSPSGIVFRELVDVLEAAPVDWSNIAPHPRLAELEQRCRCGMLRGEHLTKKHDASERAERWPCNGFRAEASSKAGAL